MLLMQVFIPVNDGWYLLYIEQRNGRGYIWQQKFNLIFDTNNRIQNNATQVCLKVWRELINYF